MSRFIQRLKLHHSLMQLNVDNACSVLEYLVREQQQSKRIFDSFFDSLIQLGDDEDSKINAMISQTLDICNEKLLSQSPSSNQIEIDCNENQNRFDKVPIAIMSKLTSYLDLQSLLTSFAVLSFEFCDIVYNHNQLRSINLQYFRYYRQPTYKIRFNFVKKLYYFSNIQNYIYCDWEQWSKTVENLTIDHSMLK